MIVTNSNTNMSAAHILYSSYASCVSSGDASPHDFKSLVDSIKDPARCICLPCKVITMMCSVCDSDDEYIKSMCEEMIATDAWETVVMGEYAQPTDDLSEN